MTLDIDHVIERLGGAERAAALVGVGTEAIRKWRQSRAIPTRHWSAIIASTGLSFADLQGLALQGLALQGLAEPGAPTVDAGMPGQQGDAPPDGATAVLVLADGTRLWGRGFGANSTDASRVGELCFNTGMTGYQETLTDPSYAAQIITFTFPHIGNVGANAEDLEANTVAARGLVTKQDLTEASNWRASQSLDRWLRSQDVTGIAGVDTRALTLRLRDVGPMTGVLSFPADGRFDLPALAAAARDWPGLAGMDLARQVSCTQSYGWTQTAWTWPGGFGQAPPDAARRHVVAVDYGAKRNILRCLAATGSRVTVVPADTSGTDMLRLAPDGVFLSNGPGDPAATAAYAVPAIQAVLAAGVPIFGICLGHQLLALALGARTYKLQQGHRGQNQPVRELATGRVEITSQNHGFAVDDGSLPDGVRITHTSLFDGSNEGIACEARRAFSVQYHPEATPGPSDSRHLFERFVALMDG